MRKKRRRTSQGAVQNPRKTRPIEVEDDDEDHSPQYQYLASTTHEVARHTIDAKWGSLPRPAIDRISQLLSDVERSVIMRLQDERKRTQASTAIEMIVRRLHGRLSRGQPFPPSTRSQYEEDFDFEKILDSSRALEAQLTPMLHSIELLKAEAAKEEALLESESATLETLEDNAKAEATQRKKAAKKMHKILLDDQKSRVETFVTSSGLDDREARQRLSDVRFPIYLITWQL